MGANLTIYSSCLDVLTRRFRMRASRGEALLWDELRGKRLRGYKFERRCQVDRYVVDFYCDELHLAVDIASAGEPWHGSCADQERTIRLRLCGVVYLPFAEDEVLHNLEGVVSRIRQAIRYLPWR